MDAPKIVTTRQAMRNTIEVHPAGYNCAVKCGCGRSLVGLQHHIYKNHPQCDTCIAATILGLHGNGGGGVTIIHVTPQETYKLHDDRRLDANCQKQED